MVKKWLLALAVVAVLLSVGLVSGWKALGWYGHQPLVSPNEALEQSFVIHPGDSLTSIAHRLSAEGWLDSPQLFIVMAKVGRLAKGIQAGEYMLSQGMTRRELLIRFISGDVREFNITLVEGSTFADAVNALNENEKLKPISEEGVRQLLLGLGIEGNPEGLFFPDTYRFHSGDAAASILFRARKRMKNVLEHEWQQRDQGLPYKTPYQALIMASLVEKETGIPSERSEIAGVFVRRLHRGMRLQTDPTVIYGQGGNYKGNITRKMLKEYSPYNTYRISGLPPTPISFVGREAIRAALHPKKGRSLYFVARGDGSHYFSNTLVEHNQAVRRYQIFQRRDDYRSTVISREKEI